MEEDQLDVCSVTQTRNGGGLNERGGKEIFGRGNNRINGHSLNKYISNPLHVLPTIPGIGDIPLSKIHKNKPLPLGSFALGAM